MPTESSPTYSVTNTTGAQDLYNGAYTISGEYCTSSSVLVGKEISKIEIPMQRIGNAGGTVTLGVFNSSGTTIHTYGTFDISTISSTAMTWQSGESTAYTIQSGQTIGVKYQSGNSSEKLRVWHWDSTPTFDGTNSVWNRNAGSDNTYNTVDQSFKFYLWEEESSGGGSGGSSGGGEEESSGGNDVIQGEGQIIDHILYLNTRVPK